MNSLSAVSAEASEAYETSTEEICITHKSLALAALCQRLRHDRKYHILDLGPALGANVEFFSQFRCKLYIEDFYQSVAEELAAAEAETPSPEQLYQKLLPYAEDIRFDVILCWDLFNYLPRQELQALLKHLTRYCQRGTLLFSLVATHHQIPARPILFKILNKENLIYKTYSSDLRPSIEYKPRDLKLLMQGFQIANTFQLRSGMQEFLFIHG
jgi:2-polyprenyl-3-methyl-5-hydroxy-6-metoxy-1,4-benzoquinol methylase